MVKNQTNILGAYGLAALAFVALISSCGGNSNPAGPSATGVQVQGEVLFALPPDDAINLKAPAPLLQSPINNVEVADLTPTFIVGNVNPLHLPAGSVDFTYRYQAYQVLSDGGMVLAHDNTAPNPSYTVSLPLEQSATMMWRSRVQIGDENGPWSNAATFRTPTLVTIGAPTPISPTDGADVTATRPELIVTNGEVSASAGAIEVEYQINDGPAAEGGSTFKVSMGGGGTTTGVFEDALPPGQYSWRARASNGPVTSDWSATAMFNVVTGGPGTRAPDPPPGQMLPLPDQEPLIRALAASHAVELGDSCVEEGGSWAWMDEAIRQLRETDTRWGYNCKRGHCNEISIDIANYHWGAGPSDGSQEVYIIDIISAVCPDGNQGPSWQDQTDQTHEEGAIGVWIFPRE